VKRLAADRSRWKSFLEALCSYTGDSRKWWWSPLFESVIRLLQLLYSMQELWTHIKEIWKLGCYRNQPQSWSPQIFEVQLYKHYCNSFEIETEIKYLELTNKSYGCCCMYYDYRPGLDWWIDLLTTCRS
jgi:hypothetical protein